MNRTTILTIAICVVVTICITMAVGQSGSNDIASSRYSVATVGDSAVLVETLSGKTWLLHRSMYPTESAVWIPINRLEDAAASAEWHAIERERIDKSAVMRKELEMLNRSTRNRVIEPQLEVIGEVNRPGIYLLYDPEGSSLVKALALAGGYTPDADRTRIMVLSKDKIHQQHVDLEQVLVGNQQDVTLEAGDTVFVPSKKRN